MKVRPLLGIALVLFSMGTSLFGALQPAPAQASGEQYLFYYDSKDVSTIKQAFSANGLNTGIQSGLAKTTVYAKNGVYGKQPFAFTFNQNSGLGSAGGGTQGSNGTINAVYASNTTLDCTVNQYTPSNNAQVLPSTIKLPYTLHIPLTMTVPLKASDITSGPGSTTSYNTVTGSLSADLNQITADIKTPDSLDSASTTESLSQLISDESLSVTNALIIGFIPQSCLPSPLKIQFDSQHLYTLPDAQTQMPKYVALLPTVQKSWPGVQSSDAILAADTPGAGNPASNPASTTFDDQCNIDAPALGWILCSVIETADKAINTVITQVLIPELTVTPLSTSDPAYAVWQSIRLLANVLFILAFLVIIFANTLNFNVETYTIKKMIPRLVAAAILVQFSFVISSAIIDIGNIIGNGIVGVVNVGVLKGVAGSSPTGTLSFLGGALVFTSLTLLAVAVPTLVGVAVAALIGALGVLVTLTARKLIIILLVILSPLAFAAWILPNTERMFKLWLNNFIRITLMFAMIMILFSAASIGTYATGKSGFLSQLISALFPVIAFFMIPMTFKWAGGAMNFASGYISNFSGKASSGARGKWDNSRFMQARRAAKAEKRADRLAHWATEEEPTVFGNQRLGRARQGAAKRWATGSRFKIGDYGERQLKALRQQQIAATEEKFKGVTPSEIVQALQDAAGIGPDGKVDPKKKKDKDVALAAARVLSRQGMLDQPQMLAYLSKAFEGDPGQQKAIEEAIAQNFGGLKRDARALYRLQASPTELKSDRGETMESVRDQLDENGKLTSGMRTALSIASTAPEALASQTDVGMRVILDGKVSKDAVQAMASQIEQDENGNYVATGWLADKNLTQDILKNIKANEGNEEGMALSHMISDAAREGIKSSSILRSKITQGTAGYEVVYGSGVPHYEDSGDGSTGETEEPGDLDDLGERGGAS